MAQDIKTLTDMELEGAIGGTAEAYNNYAMSMIRIMNSSKSNSEKLTALKSCREQIFNDSGLTYKERSGLLSMYQQFEQQLKK